MDILVLDIGCSYTKAFVYRNNKVIEKWRLKTILTADGIIDASRKLVNRADAEGFEFSVVIPTSFSESVIVEDVEGNLELFGPTLPFEVANAPLPPYIATGYPSTFPGVGRILYHLISLEYPIRRALPVSAMVSAQLAGNADWKFWDWTHASNTGIYGNGHWKKEARLYREWLNINQSISPFTCVGNMENGVPVLLGGHDTLFAIYPDAQAYVSTGTYIIASEPAGFMSRIPEVSDSVRYVQDTLGNYHRQICFKAPGKLTLDVARRIHEFLNTPAIRVFGVYAHEMGNLLSEFRFTPIYDKNPKIAQSDGVVHGVQNEFLLKKEE